MTLTHDELEKAFTGNTAGAGVAPMGFVPVDYDRADDASAKLLNEFKMAAQSLIEVWSEGEKCDYPEELQKHIDWFKELLD